MLNQIAFKQKPEELILNPYTSKGFAALKEPEFIWRPIPRAQIQGFAVSEHPEINEKIENYLGFTQKHKAFPRAIEFNTFPVVLQNAWFKKSFVTVDNQCLISGAAGIRLLNRYCWENGETDANAEQTLTDYFLACQNSGLDGTLPVVAEPPPDDTPFAIECRNTFNYYHFVTESLCQLCLVAETGLTGPIYMHYPNNDAKTRPFTKAFVEALFPELAHRVIFQRAPVHHPLVVCAYNFTSSFYQMPAVEAELLDLEAPPNTFWRGRIPTRSSHGVLAMNSVDSSLIKLRERALKAIKGQDFSHLPKRFWVGRTGGDQARSREMKGEADILDMLKLFGFESVVFERLSPLEQIAIMANAEMMVSYHGAGFTNMLFAGPQTCVVELGTLQTAMFRWGDFWRLANAAQCRYVTFFADFNSDDPLKEPAFSEDGIVPVHLSPAGLAQVMSFIVASLGKLPMFSRPTDVTRLGNQLMKVGERDLALALFRKHQGLEQGDVGLSLAMADCYESFKDHMAQLAALHSAYLADPTAWAVLIRLVWCAKALDQAEALSAALEALKDGFPDRFEGFAKSRSWVAKYVQKPPQSQAS